MPERNLRRSPARAAAAAAKAATAVSSVRNKSASSPKKSPKDKSPGRKSRQTEKSPARRGGKSPSRRGEKSPSRAAQKSSPSRKKSPSRKPKSPIKESGELSKSLHEEIIRVQPEVLLVNHERRDGFLTSEAVRASRESSVSSILKRRSLRVISSREKVEEKYEESKGIEQLKITDETDVEYPEKPSKKDDEPVKEFGGTLGALFLPIIFQVFVLATHLYVSKAQYGIKGFKIPLDWQTYFDLEVAAVYLGFVVLQLILSILPIGKLVDGLPGKLGKLQYRCNGIVNLIITAAIIAGLRHFKYPVTFIVDKFIPFIITSLLFGHVLAMILYAKGGRSSFMAQNPYAVTGSRIYDYYMGREINPRIGPFDVKIGLLRIAFIGMIVVNVAFILKSLDQNKGYSLTLLVAAGLQMWYALDALWCEESFLSSFVIMYEGTGQMFILHAVAYPFIPTIITRSILNYRWETPVYVLVIICVIQAVGYVIYRGSNSQKSQFRRNPLNPTLAHLETIPTTRGKKILVSGWWGWVRHPNYLGDIIMEWCWASPCGIAHPLPYIVPLYTSLLLVYRAERDDDRCRQRYSASWDRYSNRVKYRIMPKVF